MPLYQAILPLTVVAQTVLGATRFCGLDCDRSLTEPPETFVDPIAELTQAHSAVGTSVLTQLPRSCYSAPLPNKERVGEAYRGRQSRSIGTVPLPKKYPSATP